MDGFSGLAWGFLGLDLSQPLYCFNDGLMAQAARLTLSEEYKTSFDPNVLVNVIDTSIPLLFKCNIISMAGGPASLPLYLYSKDIVAWTNAN